MTDTYGLFGSVFCDFGDEFVVFDTNGEEPVSAMIASITSDSPGLVTVLDEGRHGLEDGDYVTFAEVKGMEALNGSEARPVTVKGPYTFTIEDTTGYSKETATGGYVHQLKQKKTLKFKSLRESLAQPEFLISDFAKFDRPSQLHYGFQALHGYAADHGGAMPPPSDAAAAGEVLRRAKALAEAAGEEVEFSERMMRNLASGARGELSPMCAAPRSVTPQPDRRRARPTACGVSTCLCQRRAACRMQVRLLRRDCGAGGDEGGVGQVLASAAVALLRRRGSARRRWRGDASAGGDGAARHALRRAGGSAGMDEAGADGGLAIPARRRGRHRLRGARAAPLRPSGRGSRDPTRLTNHACAPQALRCAPWRSGLRRCSRIGR